MCSGRPPRRPRIATAAAWPPGQPGPGSGRPPGRPRIATPGPRRACWPMAPAAAVLPGGQGSQLRRPASPSPALRGSGRPPGRPRIADEPRHRRPMAPPRVPLQNAGETVRLQAMPGRRGGLDRRCRQFPRRSRLALGDRGHRGAPGGRQGHGLRRGEPMTVLTAARAYAPTARASGRSNVSAAFCGRLSMCGYVRWR